MGPRSVLRALSLLPLAIALVGCTDEGDIAPATGDEPGTGNGFGGVAREVRAAELFAPREALALVGTRWQLEAVTLPDLGKAPFTSGLVHTIEFDGGGKRARGHDGCGAYERGYEVVGAALVLEPATPVPAPGDAAPCEPSELARIEGALVDALLVTTERFEIRGDRLFLGSPDGAALVLRGQSLGEIPAGVGPGVEPEFDPGEAVPFAVLERSQGLNLGARDVSVPDRFVTVHDTPSLEALWRNAHSFDDAVPVPDFDFDVGSVIAVFSPLRPSLGYSIGIETILASAGAGPEDGPLVRVISVEPGPGCLAGEALSVPYEIVGVPTLAAAPRFQENVVRGEPCG